MNDKYKSYRSERVLIRVCTHFLQIPPTAGNPTVAQNSFVQKPQARWKGGEGNSIKTRMYECLWI